MGLAYAVGGQEDRAIPKKAQSGLVGIMQENNGL
jgi:hypothetical protein